MDGHCLAPASFSSTGFYGNALLKTTVLCFWFDKVLAFFSFFFFFKWNVLSMSVYVPSRGALRISSGQCYRTANHPEGVFLGEALSLQRIEGPPSLFKEEETGLGLAFSQFPFLLTFEKPTK